MGKGANFLKKRTASLLLAVLALAMCLALFSSCGKEQSADKVFGAAMDKVQNFDTDGFFAVFLEARHISMPSSPKRIKFPRAAGKL